MADAFPLAWPEGWPRTENAHKDDGRYRFKRPGGRSGCSEPWTFAAACDALVEEIQRMSPAGGVVSSNFRLDRRGLAVESNRRPDDQGIAIYFKRGGKPYAMACDRYKDAEGNMRSLALALEAMRQLERHGGGVMMEKAFAGFVALPAPKKPHEILGIKADACEAEIRSAWRSKISAAHPDQGGSEAAAAEINAARDAMLKALGA